MTNDDYMNAKWRCISPGSNPVLKFQTTALTSPFIILHSSFFTRFYSDSSICIVSGVCCLNKMDFPLVRISTSSFW